jgi:hypothetical protein
MCNRNGNGHLSIFGAFVLTSGIVLASPPWRKVECGRESLAKALSKADSGDVILVSGTCLERLVLTQDRVTLDGQGMATLDGGGPSGGSFSATVLIDSARDVTVRGFTIHNGSNGILGTGNAVFKVENTILRDNAGGIAILDGSVAEIVDCTMINNANGGMFIANGSTAIFKGSVKANNNGEGISAAGSSSLELRAGTLEASGNGAEGISLSGSSLNIYGLPESLNSNIIVNANGTDGMLIGGGQLVIFGNQPASKVITAIGNKGSGINLPGFASIANFGAGKFVLSRNGTGLSMGIESSIVMVGGLNLESNTTGLLADGAGSLLLAPNPPNPSVIRGNTAFDVDLRFGTRMNVINTSLGTLKCDGTILIKGAKCP